jgi:hypothetical protein
VERTASGSRKLTRKEVKYIAGAARDGGSVNDREAQCLREILRYKGITDEAKQYLRRYLRMSLVYRGERDVMPMSDQFEANSTQVIESASRIPVQFTLPDEPFNVYKFSYLSLIAKLLREGAITQFGYSGKSHGVYISKRDCLMIDYVEGRPNYLVHSTLVHEATHGVQDVFDWDADRGHSEAAAHLAQAVWLLFQGKPLSGRLAKPEFADLANAIYNSAASVQGKGTITTADVGEADYKRMRTLLNKVPSYNPVTKHRKKSGDIL